MYEQSTSVVYTGGRHKPTLRLNSLENTRMHVKTIATALLSATLCASLAVNPTFAQAANITDDRAEIEALLARYIFAFDWRNPDAFRDTFANEGVLVSRTAREQGDAIGSFMRQTPAGPVNAGERPVRTRHSIGNVVLDIDGDTARGRTYWILISNNNADRKGMLGGYGHYEDDLVRENGKWRFARREVFNEMLHDRASTPELPTGSFPRPPKVGNSYADNRAAIEDLQARYLFAMNWFDADAYAGTFTPDGVVYMGERVEHGHEEIRTVITDYREIILGNPIGAAQGLRPPATRHMISNKVVDIDGNQAKSWAYWNTFQNDNLERSPQIGNYGSYEDELVKIDGRWYFKSRKVFNQMRADRVAPDKLPIPTHIDAGPPANASVADDRAAIENLQARYLFALDWQDPDAYAATFTDDGVLVSAIAEAKGRAALRAEIVKMRENDRAAQTPGLFAFSRRHVITNLVLDIHGDHATGRAYWIGYINDNPDRTPALESYGHYEDDLVKINGEWQFARRQIFNEEIPGRTATGAWPL